MARLSSLPMFSRLPVFESEVARIALLFEPGQVMARVDQQSTTWINLACDDYLHTGLISPQKAVQLALGEMDASQWPPLQRMCFEAVYGWAWQELNDLKARSLHATHEDLNPQNHARPWDDAAQEVVTALRNLRRITPLWRLGLLIRNLSAEAARAERAATLYVEPEKK